MGESQARTNYIWPIDGASIGSKFGARPDPFNPTVGVQHCGVDIPANVGTPVFAAADGIVAKVGLDADGHKLGIHAWIRHGDGTLTGYGHLSRLDVQEGDKVVTREKIGEVGSTGHSTGPHLHFAAINPQPGSVPEGSSIVRKGIEYFDPTTRIEGLRSDDNAISFRSLIDAASTILGKGFALLSAASEFVHDARRAGIPAEVGPQHDRELALTDSIGPNEGTDLRVVQAVRAVELYPENGGANNHRIDTGLDGGGDSESPHQHSNGHSQLEHPHSIDSHRQSDHPSPHHTDHLHHHHMDHLHHHHTDHSHHHHTDHSHHHHHHHHHTDHSHNGF